MWVSLSKWPGTVRVAALAPERGICAERTPLSPARCVRALVACHVFLITQEGQGECWTFRSSRTGQRGVSGRTPEPQRAPNSQNWSMWAKK